MENMELLTKAMKMYGIDSWNFEATNEDRDVFKVTDPADSEKKAIIKIVCSDGGEDYLPDENLYHTKEQLEVEMEILEGLNKLGAECAAPLRNTAGAYISELFGDSEKKYYAYMTTFLSGGELTGVEGDPAVRGAVDAGVTAAKIHNASEQGVAEIAKKRPHRNEAYMERVKNILRLGVEKYHTLNEKQLGLLLEGADQVIKCMKFLDENPKRHIGLVHTDLRYANFMFSEGKALPVDFTRSVYGYHLYDLGEMCAHMGKPEQILEGYNSVRPFEKGEREAVGVFYMMFLLILIAARIDDGVSDWFKSTVEKLCVEIASRKEMPFI